MKVETIDTETGNTISTITKKVATSKGKPAKYTLNFDKTKRTNVIATFTEGKSTRSISSSMVMRYILTPDAPATPRFNTTALYGVRPGSPIHFRFGVSGERPMKFSSADLPKGL